MKKEGNEIAKVCINGIAQRLGECGGLVLSYKESLHEHGYWETLGRIKNMMETWEAHRKELTVILQTLSDARNG